MRYFIYAGGGAFITAWLHWNIWAGIVAGLVAAIMLTPKASTHRVIVENIETGQVKIQPNDRATQQYLNTRND
jgi:hypothetical protein